MKQIRRTISLIACKLAIWASRLAGKKGSSMPGSLALKLYPNLLKDLASQVKHEIIVVCGTNGKTTTNNLLYSFIKSKGHDVVCNNIGANMLYGVCCAFAAKAKISGKLVADYACIEVDEASCVKVFDHFQPHIMLITNLFRDQLDRYGEIDITVDYLKKALAKAPDTILLLNGDDPLTAQFGENTTRTCYYAGVDENVGIGLQEVKEGRFCVICNQPLEYEYYHYSQLGKFHCTACGFGRKEPDFRAYEVNLNNGIAFSLDYKNTTKKFQVNYRGFYNIYNIILSYGAAILAVGDIPDFDRLLGEYQPQVGRMEEFDIGKKAVLNLSKNPAGFNQAISTVLADEQDKDLLIVINDNAQDGKDISWLWDVDFERLNHTTISNFILSGIRADDLAVRLKYAGIDTKKMVKIQDLKEACTAAANGSGSICYALVNYTAVFKMQDILKELERGRGLNHGI